MRFTARVSAMVCLAMSACSDVPTATPDARSDIEISAPVAHARIARNTIDPVGSVIRNGHRLALTGPIECTPGEVAHLRVTVSQRTTGAVAEGTGRVTCSGSGQKWTVQLSTMGSATFEAGAAIAVALARTTDHGKVTDAHQWLVNIALAE